MKCPGCGAEIGDSKVCEFCGTRISTNLQVEEKKAQEQLNKQGCPKCGSTNIEFKRENMGEVRGKDHKRIVHTTVGYCKDCGYTWYPQGETVQVPTKRKTWLWVLGWICCFPIPLTILMLRKKDMKPVLKYGIIALAWLIYIGIGISGSGSDSTETPDTSTETQVEEQVDTTEESSEATEAESKDIIAEYDNDIVVAAKMSLDNSLTDYDVSLAPQNWTLAKFDDEGAVIATTDIDYQGTKTPYIYVGTLNFEGDKVTSATPHYLQVGDEVLGDDGYCDDVFDKIKELTGE